MIANDGSWSCTGTRGRTTDADQRRIEAELDHAAWRSVRPLFLALVLVLVSLWAIAVIA